LRHCASGPAVSARVTAVKRNPRGPNSPDTPQAHQEALLRTQTRLLWHRFTKAMDPYVFLPAAALVLLFVSIGSFLPDRTEAVFALAQQFIATHFGWFYVVVTLLLLILCVVIVFSRWGRLRLGPDDSRPEYSRVSWLAMLFSAGMDSGSLVDDIVTSGGHPDPPRIQRVFWAVSEGLVAITLLLAGGLQALQTASLTVGLPMAVVLLVTGYGLLIEMRRGGDPR